MCRTPCILMAVAMEPVIGASSPRGGSSFPRTVKINGACQGQFSSASGQSVTSPTDFIFTARRYGSPIRGCRQFLHRRIGLSASVGI